MSFIKRLHQIETERGRLLDVIRTFNTDTKASDLSKETLNSLITNTPQEMIYKLSYDLINDVDKKELLRLHYLNPFTQNTDINIIKTGIDIMVNYDYYGVMDNEKIKNLLASLSQENKINLITKGQTIGQDCTDLANNIIKQINDNKIVTFADLLLAISEKPKYAYHIISKLSDLLKSSSFKITEPYRYHELNIFDNITSYGIVKEWLEIMKDEYYYKLDEDRFQKFMTKLNDNETDKVKKFFKQFVLSDGNKLLLNK
ncbi:hypothetical protein QKU48_gp0706 [Fadolivirus algeromassiliense]|jgi:hypothetical protein|uniref:Uncharacterized protein n=1 Tax=Fadolivirus FV1/VV64 TaxID=3070911 RepID=A0A7D3QVC6_9VIRU|nr:hypothetical protein QKU48_gp0706 [Fadolivirus algeromassiliense]QKF94164.1 hypothetical protein Fadolivirus_1_706 [Fadolivirus FV1/VV64]